MRRILSLIFLLTSLVLSGQDLPQILKERGEISFNFTLHDKSELAFLTEIISIDRVDGLQVRAYANVAQFLEFSRLGYDIQLLPPAGTGVEVEMRDDVTLSPSTVWNFYPTYSAYESLMVQFQSNFPGLCMLDTLTTLASGRRLLVLKISDNVASDEPEPEFLYSSSIHGDETTGYILMMHLADYLLTNYGTNPEATELVDNMEIYICPLANPDGTYYGGNSSVSGARRGNINNVDMNRNYPDPQNGPHPDGNAWQAETVAFMDFAAQRHFVAGANFHGGVEVVNYPWDTWATLHADNSHYVMISREYADTVHLHAPLGYMDYLSNGVTNGYAWYEVNGGRQDYMNYFYHCKEITIEISDVKLLASSQLLAHWDYNWRSLILLLKQARYGVHGVVTSQATGLPVEARVFINGHDNNGSEVYSSATVGDYHRLLKAGTYTLEFSAPCYHTQTIPNIVVADYGSVSLNVQMIPTVGAITSAVSGITSTTALCGGSVCDGDAPVIARGVCWSLSANPTVNDQHTLDGTGPGAFVSAISGLSPSSTYHVRAYATTETGTVYGNDIRFKTSCGTVTAFPWTEDFENGGVIPTCLSQQQINNSGINWTFITGSGNNHPSTAHSGSYNACLKDNNSTDNKTRLIIPAMNLTNLPQPVLKFWHTQAAWYSDQDVLSVYYRISATGTWTLLTSYSTSVTSWTQRTLTLPNPTADYFIAFEGNAKYGYGICVDDVEITSSCSQISPVSVSISPDANPVAPGTTVTFTATAVNGGTNPSFVWKKNGQSVAGATSAIYSDLPVDQDYYSCVLTSGLTCVSGNPAVSDTITIHVADVPVNLNIGNDTVMEGEQLCADAIQNLYIAGNDQLFMAEGGSQVTLIAGHSIHLLPGTLVLHGAFLEGLIRPYGPFCETLTDRGFSSGSNLFAFDKSSSNLWKVYPNPTNGMINISSNHSAGQADISVYDYLGSCLMKIQNVNFDHAIQLSLEQFPAGIYHILIKDRSEQTGFRIIRLK